jgi:uncharacterized protein
MDVKIGHVQAIYRYPVKSMAGETLEHTQVSWYGLEGDRRFAFRRVAERGGFPWLSASRVPELILYKPVRQDSSQDGHLPTHVVTPDGKGLGIRSDELRDEITHLYGAEVEMMHLRQGVFDDAAISVLSLATCHKITTDSGVSPDVRRFRPNIVIDTHQSEPFAEDQWVGKTVIFGSTEENPAVQVTVRDLRCAMLNLNPDTAQSDPAVMKTVVQLNDNFAGVYGTVIRAGTLVVGQPVYLSDTVFNSVNNRFASGKLAM